MPDVNIENIGDLGIETGTPSFGGSGELDIDALKNMGLLTGGTGVEGDAYTGMFADILGSENVEGKLKYFESYDPVKEQMAQLTRGQSELEAKQGYQGAIKGAQAQTGKSLGQAYAQGRSGGGGFGGAKPTVAQAGQQAMRGYGQAKMGAGQQMQGQMYDAEMAETKSIKGSQDAYKSQVMQLLGMLGD
tara:strand:- start:5629 stop:6195 length:567 start_codon:yes stop_codon:yes gene_type:complete